MQLRNIENCVQNLKLYNRFYYSSTSRSSGIRPFWNGGVYVFEASCGNYLHWCHKKKY